MNPSIIPTKIPTDKTRNVPSSQPTNIPTYTSAAASGSPISMNTTATVGVSSTTSINHDDNSTALTPTWNSSTKFYYSTESTYISTGDGTASTIVDSTLSTTGFVVVVVTCVIILFV